MTDQTRLPVLCDLCGTTVAYMKRHGRWMCDDCLGDDLASRWPLVDDGDGHQPAVDMRPGVC